MANTTAVYARIDTNLKETAEGILAQLGISPSAAIQMLYSQIILERIDTGIYSSRVCHCDHAPLGFSIA